MFIGIGLPITRGKGVGGYTYVNAEAAALAARFTTPPTDARAALIDNLIGSLKTAGVWTKLDALYIMAAAGSQAARQNWVANQFNLTAVSAPTFTPDRGFTGDGSSSYLDTNMILASGAKYTQDAAHFGLWSRTAAQSSGIDMGARVSAAVDQSVMLIRATLDNFNVRINAVSTPPNISTSITDGSGHFVGNRPDSGHLEGFRNGALLANIAYTSSARPSLSAFIGALNAVGAAASFAARQYAAAHIGGALSASEVSAMYAAVNTYVQAVGAA